MVIKKEIFLRSYIRWRLKVKYWIWEDRGYIDFDKSNFGGGLGMKVWWEEVEERIGGKEVEIIIEVVL